MSADKWRAYIYPCVRVRALGDKTRDQRTVTRMVLGPALLTVLRSPLLVAPCTVTQFACEVRRADENQVDFSPAIRSFVHPVR